MYLKQNVIPRTSTFRDSFFQRIVNMWNVLPVEIKMAKSISSFKEKLKSLLFFRLNNIFKQDNIDTYKLICHKCRSSNVYTVCSCKFSFSFLFLFLLFVFDLFLTQGVIVGRVAYFTVGGCQVLEPCRGLVSFCSMYLVLCTKSENK